MKKFFLALIIILGAFICITFLIRIFLADVYYKKSRDFYAQANFEEGFVFINYAIEANPHEPLYYLERAKLYLSLSLRESAESLPVLKKLALSDLKKSYDLGPKNLRTIRNSFSLYFYLSVLDMSKNTVEGNLDPAYLQIARDFYLSSKNTYPNDAGLITDVAFCEKKLHLEKDYQNSVERIKKLRPDLLEWHPTFLN